MTILPDEIIRHILEFNADFHPNLLECHKEMLKYRPCFYKRVKGGFTPGLSDHPTWHNFKKNNHQINVYIPGTTILFNLKLYAIEITPERERNTRFYHSRDIILYYGWERKNNKIYWNNILLANENFDLFSPGYY